MGGEGGAGGGQVGLDRALGQAEVLGHLADRQVEQVVEADDPALLLGEPGDGGGQIGGVGGPSGTDGRCARRRSKARSRRARRRPWSVNLFRATRRTQASGRS